MLASSREWPSMPRAAARCSSAGFAGAIRFWGRHRRGPSRPPPTNVWGATPPSELESIAQRDQRQVDGVAEGVALPLLVGDPPRVLEIVPEDLGHPRGHSLVEEGDVQLVVELERAVVEVGAADGDPLAAHDHRLGVQERGTVLVDLCAGLEHASEVRLARLAHDAVERRVDDARRDDLHVHAALGRADERVRHPSVRNEVGIGDQDRRARGIDGEQEQHVGFRGAARRRALDRLRDQRPARRQLGKVRVAAEQEARGVAPVLGEGGLQEAHDRSLDAHVGLAPVPLRASVAGPLLTHARATGEADAAVDDENAAMVAMVDPLDRDRIERVITRHVAAGLLHQRPVLARHALAADGIDQHVDADARARALGERVRHIARDIALLLDEVGEGDRLLRRADRPPHRRKDLLAVPHGVRGQAAPEILGNPRRLLYPMLRATRSGRWRRATWDEALDLIVQRMRAAGREAVATWPGHGIFANNYGTRIHSHLLRRFSNIYGCQWWSPAIICWALGGFGLGLTGLLEPNTKEDMGANANLILLWGANLASQPNTGRHLAAAKRRGARIVTIDVRETEAAAQSDETVLVRPGTDAALALGMMHVLIAEGLVDRAFVARHTLGFEPLAAHVATQTPEWAERVTGVPAARIVALARRYGTSKPAMIVLGGSSM